MKNQKNLTKEQEALIVIFRTLDSLYQTFYGVLPSKIDTSIAELLIEIKERVRSGL